MKKVLFLSICIIAALALLPGGNAAWEERLEVSGHVKTAGSIEDAAPAPSVISAPAAGKSGGVTPAPDGEAQPESAMGDQGENGQPANHAPLFAEDADTTEDTGASFGDSHESSAGSFSGTDCASDSASSSPSTADSAADSGSGGSSGDTE